MLIKRKKVYIRQPNTVLTPAHSTAISMGRLIKKICNIQQPNSLSQNYFYSYNKSKKYQYIKLINNANQILNYFFGTFYALISRPVYLFTQNKIIIFINYYRPKTSKRLFTRYIWKYNKVPSKSAKKLILELKTLVLKLSNLFNLKVELQLNRLKYPYQDSQILSKLIALGSNLNRFRTIMNLIIRESLVITKALKDDKKKSDFYSVIIDRKTVKIHKTVPTVLTGLKVRISGRLSTERVIPKKTVTQKEIGGFIRDKNSLVDYAIYNSKNKRGSYSVKVWTTSKICR